MSRSGYVDDYEYIELYRATVERALRGERGQFFLRELADVMDAMPEKVLIADALVDDYGDCCAIGAVCLARGMDVSAIDYDDPEAVGAAVGISRSMAAEIEFMNDEWWGGGEDPAKRWERMRKWVAKNIVESQDS